MKDQKAVDPVNQCWLPYLSPQMRAEGK